MRRYAVFLRSVNVSGKNAVPMAELKKCLEDLGFADVRTVLNSGNAAFSCPAEDAERLTGRIESALQDRFGSAIPAFVIARDDLAGILQNAPDWWGTGDRAIYDNLIFVMPPTVPADVLRELGEPKDGLEQIKVCNQAIFWSFDRDKYRKTNWWPKTAGMPIGKRLTIRTANTVRKLEKL